MVINDNDSSLNFLFVPSYLLIERILNSNLFFKLHCVSCGLANCQRNLFLTNLNTCDSMLKNLDP